MEVKHSIIGKKEWHILKALETGAKTIEKIMWMTDDTWHNTYHKLQQLLENKYVTAVMTKMPAKTGGEKEVTAYGITDLGFEAIKFYTKND